VEFCLKKNKDALLVTIQYEPQQQQQQQQQQHLTGKVGPTVRETNHRQVV